MKNPYEYYTIRSFKQDRYHNGICAITRRTPKLWSTVATFDSYMQREMRYDFPMFDVDGNGDGVAAYLFGYGGAWVGACGFRSMAKTDTSHCGVYASVSWQLEWIWLHPFCRRRGLLSKAWPQFEEEHGEFLILSPLSLVMERFLEKQGVAEDRIIHIGPADERD